MHGEPSWSFLYRKMIPVLVKAGHRCIAPDLVGFGRSDKPSEQDDYTYARHVRWMSEVVFEQLDLRDITFFGQDWGSLVGLRLVTADPDRYARVVIGNGGMPTGDRPPNEAFLAWQNFAKTADDFPIGGIISGGCASTLTEDVVAAYDAPFPDDTYKAGARAFPSLVPTSPDDPEHDANVKAWDVLRAFEKPFLCAFSDSDPITKGGERQFIGHVPGTGRAAAHEDRGRRPFPARGQGRSIAGVIADFIAST